MVYRYNMLKHIGDISSFAVRPKVRLVFNSKTQYCECDSIVIPILKRTWRRSSSTSSISGLRGLGVTRACSKSGR